MRLLNHDKGRSKRQVVDDNRIRIEHGANCIEECVHVSHSEPLLDRTPHVHYHVFVVLIRSMKKAEIKANC
jgi:hypothetical protein